MSGIRGIIKVELIICLLFIIGKGWVRPFVLAGDFHVLFDIIVLSFPNSCEGIIGMISTSVVLLFLNKKILNEGHQLSVQVIYLIALVLAGIFVITQELKIHNLGGNNVYDPYDVLFSALGLSAGYLIIRIQKPDYYLQ